MNHASSTFISGMLSFQPSLPSKNDRYTRKYIVQPCPMIAPADFSTRIVMRHPHMNPPEGWIQHTHPEGSTFFYNSALRLFTDNNARDDTVRAHLETAHGDIQRQRDEQKMHYTDMYIRITTGTSPVSCEYYLIDHINRNVFWTNDMTSTDLELQDGVSGTQFGHLLEDEYWTHVEFFPMGVFNLDRSIRLLFSVLGTARLDLLTSTESTFPYDAAQCQQFIEILQNPWHDPMHLTWAVARLSSVMARHRFDNLHGEEHARLDRSQTRLGRASSTRGIVGGAAAALVLGLACPLVHELDALLVDDVLCTVHWRQFIGTRHAEWRDAALGAALLLGIAFGGALLTHAESARAAGLMAALLAAGSLLTGTALRVQYSRGEKLAAADMIGHVLSLRHPRYGFHLAAAALALPQALQIWALLALCAQLILSGAVGLAWGPLAYTVCGFAAFLGLLLLAMGAVVCDSLGGDRGDGDGFSWRAILPTWPTCWREVREKPLEPPGEKADVAGMV